MKFTHLGGATGILEHKGTRILFDPWVIDGIFHGAWYHYPPSPVKINDLGRFDYIYISHIHEDHCAATTIQHLNRDAEILLLDRKPNYVLQFLKQNNFNFKKVHLIKERTPTPIAPGMSVDMLPGDITNELSYLIDSMMIMQWDGFTYVNGNDCQFSSEALDYIVGTYPKIDLALLPFSGGSGYPACYLNLTDQEKIAERDRIITMRAQAFAESATKLNSVYAMPFADQYVIAGSRAHLNKYVGHSSSVPPQLVESMCASGIENRLLLLNAGQSYDFGIGKKIPNEPFHFFTDEDRESFISQHLSDKVYDHELIQIDSRVSIKRLIELARQRLWNAQQTRQSFRSINLYLDVPDRNERYRIPLDQPHVEALTGDAPLVQPFLRVAADSTLMTFLLIGHESWNIADAALFLDYERRPNTYDPEVYVLMNLLKV